MTGLQANNKFCFHETLNVSRGEVLCYTSQHKTRKKKLQRNRLLYAGWLINLLWFQEARPYHERIESSCCCFPGELVSFVRPRELVSFVSQGASEFCLPQGVSEFCFPRESVSFDLRHVVRFPPIGKRIRVGRCNNKHLNTERSYKRQGHAPLRHFVGSLCNSGKPE